MLQYKRGAIFWVKLGILGNKCRPCLVVSNDSFNQTNPTVMVLPFSTSLDHTDVADPRKHVTFKIAGDTAQILVEYMCHVNKRFINNFVGFLSDEEMGKVEYLIREHLGIGFDACPTKLDDYNVCPQKYESRSTSVPVARMSDSMSISIAEFPRYVTKIASVTYKTRYTDNEKRYIVQLYNQIQFTPELLQKLSDQLHCPSVVSLAKKVGYYKRSSAR